METATLWKVKVIRCIGKFLAKLPNARELYKNHVMSEEDAALATGEGDMEDEEDVFGFAAGEKLLLRAFWLVSCFE